MNRSASARALAAATILSAAAGQARAQDFELVPFVSITSPLEMYQTPIPGDDRFFVVRQNGIISIVENGSVLPTAFLNIGGEISTGGEQGLLDMEFHPGFGVANNYFYINFTNASGNTVIRRYAVSGSDPNVADTSTATTILAYNQDFTNHNGGQLRFGPDGYLYIPTGDGGSGNDPNCRAQSANTLLGKILRIDVDGGTPYAIPPGNPFAGPGDPLDEIWAFGLRNPWRTSFDRLTGDMWIGDVGQGAREEVSFQPASSTGGENYGWKVMEGFNCTGNTGGCSPLPPPCNDPAYTLPEFDYARVSPHCAVTGGFVYRGAAIPSLQGKYIYGDYCSAYIWAYDPSTSNTQFLFDPGSFLVSFSEDRDGELYVSLQQTGNHRILKLVPILTGVGDWLVVK